MPDPLVEALVEDRRWSELGVDAIAEPAARAALAAAGREPDRHKVGLLACNDARIAELNGAFRHKAQPTNVLSWPAFDGPVPAPSLDEPLFLGDLALAYETCEREAGAAGVQLADHAAHLVVHGILHLLGYDHEDDAEAEVMEELEVKILASLGVANPYSR